MRMFIDEFLVDDKSPVDTGQSELALTRIFEENFTALPRAPTVLPRVATVLHRAPTVLLGSHCTAQGSHRTAQGSHCTA